MKSGDPQSKRETGERVPTPQGERKTGERALTPRVRGRQERGC